MEDVPAKPGRRAWLVLLGAVLLLTCVGPLVYPVDPFEMVAPPMSAPGEYGLICGSDYLGRDIFAGIIAGGKATWRWAASPRW